VSTVVPPRTTMKNRAAHALANTLPHSALVAILALACACGGSSSGDGPAPGGGGSSTSPSGPSGTFAPRACTKDFSGALGVIQFAAGS